MSKGRKDTQVIRRESIQEVLVQSPTGQLLAQTIDEAVLSLNSE